MSREQTTQQFVKLVESGAGESELHAIIKSNRWILDDYIFKCRSGISFNEYEINREMRCDYLTCSGTSYPDAHIVELKGADTPLFTSKGTMSSSLNDAFIQCANQLCSIFQDTLHYSKQLSCDLDKATRGELGKYAPTCYSPYNFEIPIQKWVNWSCWIFVGNNLKNDLESDIRESLNQIFGRIRISTYASLVRFHSQQYLQGMSNKISL